MKTESTFHFFRKSAKENIAIQILGCLVCATVLDSGYTFSIWLISCLAYWIGFVFIRSRRSETKSIIDQLFIRFATFIIFGILWFGGMFLL